MEDPAPLSQASRLRKTLDKASAEVGTQTVDTSPSIEHARVSTRATLASCIWLRANGAGSRFPESQFKADNASSTK